MTSTIDICNRALSAIGTSSTISAIDGSDVSNEALACAMLYQPTLDQLLRMAQWNFTRKTATLSLLKAAPGTPENTTPAPSAWNNTLPAIPWLYSYAYPSDCVLVRKILPQVIPYGASLSVPLFAVNTGYLPGIVPYGGDIPATPFAVAQDVDWSGNQIKNILSNQTQAIAIYNAQTNNPSLFDSMFTEALVAALAGKLVMNSTGDKGLVQAQFQIANAQVMQARGQDANEGLTVQDTVPDWIVARGYLNPYTGAGGFYTEAYAPFFGF